MKIAETVTFGGSNLNRAAHLRNAEDQKRLLLHRNAKILPVWRGKPLISEDGVLGFLSPDHVFLKHGKDFTLFLGMSEDDVPYFAVDVSNWEPEALPESLNAFLDPSEQWDPTLPEDHKFCELRARMVELTPRDAELAATARAMLEWHRTHGFCASCGAASTPASGAWQRDCPTCGRYHFPRTDPVVIMLITHGNSVLMGRSPGWPEGMYSLLAGFVEPGETVEAAVRREVFEESGIRVGAVSYLASQPWPFPASLMLGCQGIATSTEIDIDPNEIEDAMWITKTDMACIFRGEHPTISKPRNGAIAHFLLENWLADRLD